MDGTARRHLRTGRPRFRRGRLRTRRTAAAIAAYQRATTSGHADQAAEAAVNLGVLLAEWGDVEGARRAYQRVIDSGHADQAGHPSQRISGVGHRRVGAGHEALRACLGPGPKRGASDRVIIGHGNPARSTERGYEPPPPGPSQATAQRFAPFTVTRQP